MHVSCFRVNKVGVWYPYFFHYPAGKCDAVIKTVIQSPIGPFLTKKYVDCVILGKKSPKNIQSNCVFREGGENLLELLIKTTSSYKGLKAGLNATTASGISRYI